jgi:tetratricopeptide (TPR) repeat protein
MPTDPETTVRETGSENIYDDSPDAFTREGYLQSIDDSLLVEDYPRAERLLDEFKKNFGELPEYFHKKSYYFKRKGEYVKCYQHLKLLYYDFPLYLPENHDFVNLRDTFLYEKVEKAKVHWNFLINLTSKLISMESLGDEADLDAQNSLREQINEELEHVIEAYKDVIRVEAMHLQALKGLVYCYTEYGDLDEAASYRGKLEKAESYWGNLVNKRSQITLSESRRLFNEKRYDDAITILNIGLATSPGHRDLLLLKAEILQALKKFREASRCVETVFQKYANDPGANRIKKEIQAGKLDETLALGLMKLHEAEQKLPGTDLARLVREAQECFFEVLDIDGNNIKALMGLYRGQLLTGNPIKAKKTLQRLREIDPSIKVEKTLPSTPVLNLDQEPCFIATRLFGADSPETIRLRFFRETQLRPHALGRIGITLYRRIGPAMASLPGHSGLFAWIRAGLRIALRLHPG